MTSINKSKSSVVNSKQPSKSSGNDRSGFLNGNDKPGKSSGNDRSGFLNSNNKPGKSSGNDNSGFLNSNDKPGKSSGNDNSGFLNSNDKPGKSSGNDNSGFLNGNDKPGKSSGNDNSGFLNGNDKPGNGNQPPRDRVITGTSGNDTLYGGDCGRDTLVGTTGCGRGVGEKDTLIGGRGQNTFVLGDDRGSYYLGNGDCDYAEIQSFDLNNDMIKLAGSAQDYSISYSQGIASLYHHTSNAGCDLVAKINSPCGGLDLNSSYFNYVNLAPDNCGNLAGG